MAEHKHDPVIGNDGLIRCKDCGELLEDATVEVSKAGSKKAAEKILNELASTGNYYASSYEGDFIVFTRARDGTVEEITIEQLGKRNFRIIRRFRSKEV